MTVLEDGVPVEDQQRGRDGDVSKILVWRSSHELVLMTDSHTSDKTIYLKKINKSLPYLTVKTHGIGDIKKLEK